MDKNNSIICENDIPIVVPKQILVLAGHPDDEIISCGGTLLKYKALGSKIIVIVATNGVGGYVETNQKKNIIKQRKMELESVRSSLDCEIIELEFPIMDITRDKISTITNLIRDIRPQVILMPHHSDFHRVHRNLSLISREAIYHCVIYLLSGLEDLQPTSTLGYTSLSTYSGLVYGMSLEGGKWRGQRSL